VELEYRCDFEQVADRWEAFWAGEARRPMLVCIRPREGVEPVEYPRGYACAFEPMDPIIDQVLGWAETHEFLGDALPAYRLAFTTDHLALLLGAGLKRHPLGDETSWTVPCIDDLDEADIHFDRDGRWWAETVQRMEAVRRRCEGRLLVVATNLQGGLDCLAALRGTEPLLMDLIERPQAVRRALDRIADVVDEVREALAELTDAARWGTHTRHGLYSRKWIDVPQCDFSAMISPEMFREFEVPSLRREVAPLTAAEYHLDGPDAIPHLEAICGIDRIRIIQWQPGAGRASEQDWTWLHRRIDDLGTGQLFAGDAETLRRIRGEYRSPDLVFYPHGCGRDDVEKLAADLEAMG
jgi:5-methyltetrahydrofolate--homocysteine methyltransferase